MLASATVVNNAKLRAQQGFSLIELLVVVAIIGVLAAAGIVGYQSYLDGVKVDTQKNNILSLSRALQLADPARAGELSGVPYHCSRGKFPTLVTAGADNLPTTNDDDIDNALACIASAAGGAEAFAKFKSPFDGRRWGALNHDGSDELIVYKTVAEENAAAAAIAAGGAIPDSAKVPVGDSDSPGTLNDLPYLKWVEPATLPNSSSAPATVFVDADCDDNKDMLIAYAHHFKGPPLLTAVYIAGCNGAAQLIDKSEQRVTLN